VVDFAVTFGGVICVILLRPLPRDNGLFMMGGLNGSR